MIPQAIDKCPVLCQMVQGAVTGLRSWFDMIVARLEPALACLMFRRKRQTIIGDNLTSEEHILRLNSNALLEDSHLLEKGGIGP